VPVVETPNYVFLLEVLERVERLTTFEEARPCFEAPC